MTRRVQLEIGDVVGRWPVAENKTANVGWITIADIRRRRRPCCGSIAIVIASVGADYKTVVQHGDFYIVANYGSAAERRRILEGVHHGKQK